MSNVGLKDANRRPFSEGQACEWCALWADPLAARVGPAEPGLDQGCAHVAVAGRQHAHQIANAEGRVWARVDQPDLGLCPLWVKSGHPALCLFMSAFGGRADIECLLFQPWPIGCNPMAAYGGKADVIADPSACLLIAISGNSVRRTRPPASVRNVRSRWRTCSAPDGKISQRKNHMIFCH